MSPDTLTRSEIDELAQLLDDHPAPCQWSLLGSREIPNCERPADWVLTLRCARCGPGCWELCTDHRDELVRRLKILNRQRGRTGDPHIYSITTCEPLH